MLRPHPVSGGQAPSYDPVRGSIEALFPGQRQSRLLPSPPGLPVGPATDPATGPLPGGMMPSQALPPERPGLNEAIRQVLGQRFPGVAR